ncbi:hypothetical protein OTK49_21480 [Vibrio coralliirubri]|uniref:hypothetical protein n=1 Tax=Vibrio coralliirubri TaxID=1516159 RepID=UPI0022834593|nr:hypothetical protein [Vibrio coralliirubri]MCY9865094.1 hypothetical protein [Vibrio coralliirubri]
MSSNKNIGVIYLVDQLPPALKPLAGARGFVEDTELQKELNALAVHWLVFELMKTEGSRFSVLAGYHFGIAKGFQSLMVITDQYLSGVDTATNGIFIHEMHRAAQPFFADKLVAPVGELSVMAKELQALHSFAVDNIMEMIENGYYGNSDQ